MALEWSDLPHKLKRERNKPQRNDQRDLIDDWTDDVLPFQGLVQPKRGKLDNEAEGEVAKADFVLYCNFTTQKRDGKPMDIAVGDRVIQPPLFVAQGPLAKPMPDRRYRVAFVADDGGLGDHLKVWLETIGPEGD